MRVSKIKINQIADNLDAMWDTMMEDAECSESWRRERYLENRGAYFAILKTLDIMGKDVSNKVYETRSLGRKG